MVININENILIEVRKHIYLEYYNQLYVFLSSCVYNI